jgi:tRNA modification GTPase
VFTTDDSIVAIATPPGRGGIGVVRISGPLSRDIATRILNRRAPLEPRRATLSHVRAAGPAGSDTALDEVVTTYFPAPRSYTGEHVVEISAHGSPVVLHAIVKSAIDAGARLAEPGEFTLRAFLNGKRDLIQAEAVADLIAAATPLQARVAFDQLDGTLTDRIAVIDAELFDLIARLEASLDFPDEGYHFIEPEETGRRVGRIVSELDALLHSARRGRMIREGATAVVSGRPNVGKSSIFNVLAGADRAIVTPIPGTTRDLVAEQVNLEGLAVTLVDTAGWHETGDVVEREGVTRGERARAVADLSILVLDGSEPLQAEDMQLLTETAGRRRIVVSNKSDLSGAGSDVAPTVAAGGHVSVSAKTGAGMDELRRGIVRALTGDELLRDEAAMSNVRHIDLVEAARASLSAAQQAVAGGATPEEFILVNLQAARSKLEEIGGARTNEDLLRHIFQTFCIGK